MPIILYAGVEYGQHNVRERSLTGYYLSLSEVVRIVEIEYGDIVKSYLIEVRDEGGKLIRRFKPFEEVALPVGRFYSSTYGYVPCLHVPSEEADRLNIAKRYRVALLLVERSGRPLLPFEARAVGFDAQRVLEEFSRIEASLLTAAVAHPVLRVAHSYLLDSYMRLEEGDIDGARTSLRSAIQVLRDKALPQLSVPDEVKEFRGKLKSLLQALFSLMSYGGPHPGPAPRSTTEMAITVITDLIEYFAKILS